MKASALAALLAYLVPITAIIYGPKNCVSISRSAAGSCVFSTNCQGQDLSRFEFAFECESPGQDGVVRHSYGTGGFDSKEEFDTEVKCQRCFPPNTPPPQSARTSVQAAAHTHALVATSQTNRGISARDRATGFRDKMTAGQQATGLRGSSSVGMASVAQNSQKWFFSPTPIPQAKMVNYGPNQCVSTYRAEDGNCIMQTQCKKEDIKDYDFGLICVDKAGLPVRHLFGKDSFDPDETFNTLIQCHQCLGLDDIPGRVALNGQVVQLSDEVKVLRAMMTNLTSNLAKLNAAVFAPGSAWAPAPAQAPAPAPASNATNTSLFFHLQRHRRTVVEAMVDISQMTPEKMLGSWGRFAARRPIFVIVITLPVLGFLGFGWLFAGINNDDMELTWSVQGSDLENEIRTFKANHNKAWDFKDNSFFFRLKDDGDIIKPEYFQTIMDAYKSTFNITVTTSSGKTYSTYDLCSRGITPDKGLNAQACAQWEVSNRTDASLQAACLPSPLMPCFHETPLNCFREFYSVLHPSYQAIDPIINHIIPTGLPYSSRPSFITLGAEGMKSELSKVRNADGVRGCYFYDALTVFPLDRSVQGINWNHNKSSFTAKTFSLLYRMDAPKRISYRLSVMRPELSSEQDISEAIDLFSERLEHSMTHLSGSSSNLVAYFLPHNWSDNEKTSFERVPWKELIISVVLLNLLINVALMHISMPSRSHVSLGGHALSLGGLVSGASAGAIFWLGIKFNGTMVQGLPFLAMGLSCNDMFVLLLELSSMGAVSIRNKGYIESTGETCANAGMGVTLTSVCNTIAFGCASMIPIAGVSDFCKGAAIISITNFFVVMTLFVLGIALEAWRIEKGYVDPGARACHTSKKCVRQDAANDTEGCGMWLRNCLIRYYIPLLMNKFFSCGVLIVSCIALGASIWLIVDIDMGISTSELISTSSPYRDAIQYLEKYYTFSTWKLVYHDVDVAGKQQQMLDLYGNIMSIPEIKSLGLPPFLSLLYTIAGSMSALPVPGTNLTMANLGFRLEPSNGSHSVYAPAGVVPPRHFYTVFEPFSKLPPNPRDAIGANSLFIYGDVVGTNSWSYYPNRRIKMAYDELLVADMEGTQRITNMIRNVRAKINASPLSGHVFPYGVYFTYFDVYMQLKSVFWKVFGIDAAVLLIASAVFLRSPVTALASTLSCAIIVLEVFGVCALVGEFNFVTASCLLMALGISVDCTAHVISHFTLASGSKQERLSKAILGTTGAVLLGGASTITALIPMVGSSIVFIRKYYFGLFLSVVLIGVTNGLVVLPAALALLPVGSTQSKANQGLDDEKPDNISEQFPAILGTNVSAKEASV